MSRIDVKLFCYDAGDPQSPIKLERPWTKISARDIAAVDPGSGIVVIAHAGDDRLVKAWIDWAKANTGRAALMLTGSEPSKLRDLTSAERGADHSLWNIHVLDEPIRKAGDDTDTARVGYHTRLNVFVKSVLDMNASELNKLTVETIWSHFNQEESEHQKRQRQLMHVATCLVLRRASGEAAQEDYENAVHAAQMTEAELEHYLVDLDGKVGGRTYPFTIALVEVRHNHVGHNVRFVLNSDHSAAAKLETVQKTWPVTIAKTQEILKRAPLAHASSLSVRAALYLADPFGSPSTSVAQLTQEFLDQPGVREAAAKLAAAPAAPPANLAPSLEAVSEALTNADNAFRTAGVGGGFAAHVDTLHEALNRLKIRHGEKA